MIRSWEFIIFFHVKTRQTSSSLGLIHKLVCGWDCLMLSINNVSKLFVDIKYVCINFFWNSPELLVHLKPVLTGLTKMRLRVNIHHFLVVLFAYSDGLFQQDDVKSNRGSRSTVLIFTLFPVLTRFKLHCACFKSHTVAFIQIKWSVMHYYINVICSSVYITLSQR